MATQLSLIRPKSLSGMIGQELLARSIRKHIASKRHPKAWMFHGPRGFGKTSLAYILGLSYQCKHQDEFGSPCKQCWKELKRFPIYELNCALMTGIDNIREFISGADSYLLGKGSRKVYILEEAHMLSKPAQNGLLRTFEDKSNKSVFIINTTKPQDVLSTLRRRCLSYALKPLDSEHLELVVKKFLKIAGSDLDSGQLVEALIDNSITSPGLVAQAVEKYTAGNTAQDAADVEGSTDVDTKSLCHAVTKGDLEAAYRIMAAAQDSDAISLRVSVVGYLRKILLEETEIADRNEAVAKSIRTLCGVSGSIHLVQMAALTAEIYFLCKIFKQYRR